MSEPDLLAALLPVLDAFEALHVPHYVGGSLASSAHGIARASVDADVVALLQPGQVGAFVAALREAYYVPEERIHDAVARCGSFNLIHLETMLKVDVFASPPRRLTTAHGRRSSPATTCPTAPSPLPRPTPAISSAGSRPSLATVAPCSLAR